MHRLFLRIPFTINTLGLTSQSKTFYSEDVTKLAHQWIKCVEKQGDYVEKCHGKSLISGLVNFINIFRIIVDSSSHNK